MLAGGGNAVDACLAAAFAAFVTEGPLTGPAGGGFFLAYADGEPTLIDCFFAVPTEPLGEIDELDDFGVVGIELRVPAEVVDLRGGLDRQAGQLRAMCRALEARTLDAEPVKFGDLFLRHLGIEQRHADEAVGIFRQHVDEMARIGAMRARRHEHAHGDAECVHQRDVGFRQRIERGIFGARRQRIAAHRPEQMHVAVDRAARKREFGRLRIGIGRRRQIRHRVAL